MITRLSALGSPSKEARDAALQTGMIQVASRIPGARLGCVEVRPIAEDARTLRALGLQ